MKAWVKFFCTRYRERAREARTRAPRGKRIADHLPSVWGPYKKKPPVKKGEVLLMFPWRCHTRTTGFLARHQILKNLSFLVFTIEMCATHTTHTTHTHPHTPTHTHTHTLTTRGDLTKIFSLLCTWSFFVCENRWSKVHDSFVNAFFEYQLYLGNIVRSLFRPAGVYHKNTTFSTGHFSPEEPLKAGTTSQPVSMSGRTGMCVLGSETAEYAHSSSEKNPKKP